jgi:hypothetical protein
MKHPSPSSQQPTLVSCAHPIAISQTLVSGYSSLQIAMTSPDDGWATGIAESGEDVAQTVTTNGYLLHYSKGVWRQVAIPYFTGEFGIRLLNALGRDDVWFTVTQIRANPTILHYYHGTWSKLAVPQTVYPLQVLAPNSIFGSALGGPSGGEFWHYDGTTWSQVANVLVSPVQMFSSNDGWGIVDDPQNHSAFIGHWDGVTWQKSFGPIAENIWSISFASPAEGWVGGNGDDYYHYHNGTWEKVTVTYHVPDAAATFYMVSSDEGWVGGYSLFAHYQNGAWQQVPSPLGTPSAILGFSFTSPQDGWATGSDMKNPPPFPNDVRLLHYHNGIWEPYPMDTIALCLGK